MTLRFWLAASLFAFFAPPQQAPTFRAGVTFVQVDAIVTGRDGAIVRGLTKDDFQIFEDGKPQTIANFSFVDVPFDPAPRTSSPTSLVEPDVATNGTEFDGRLYVMVLDDLHITSQRVRRVKAGALQFIDRNLRPNDLMAVVYTSHTDHGQEFTNRPALLRASVERLTGDSLRAVAISVKDDADGTAGVRPPTDLLAEERRNAAFTTLVALQKACDSLAPLRGRRKAILFVGEGIDVDITDTSRPEIFDATRLAIAAAARSNVSVYGIHTLGLGGLTDEGIENGTRVSAMSSGADIAQQNLQVLSDDTGGFAVINQNDFSNAYERIIRETSSYYLLAYYPEGAAANGKSHTLDVKVSRPGLTVRARKGYTAAKGEPARQPSGSPASVAIGEALGATLPVSGLTLDVFATPFRHSAKSAAVLIGIEVPGKGLKLGSNETVEFSFVAVDAAGKVQSKNTNTVALGTARLDTRAQIERTGVRTLNRLELPPGRYQIRAAAYETAGATRGSVFYDLEVPDFFKAPLSMSGIVVTSRATSAQPTPSFDETFRTQLRAVLPAPPGALREFAPDDELIAFAEAYVSGKNGPPVLTVTTTLTREDETEVFTVDQERKVDNERCALSARFPMKDLEPAVYVLTMAARDPRGQADAVSRRLRFTVKPR